MSGASTILGGPDPEVMAAIERGSAVVFFDVALGEGANSAELGRIKLELFVKDVSIKPILARCVLGKISFSLVRLSVFQKQISAPKHARISANCVQESFCKTSNPRVTRILHFIVSLKIS